MTGQAADELILDFLGGLDLGGKRVLVIQDTAGLLCGALSQRESELTAYTDSHTASQAILKSTQGKVVPVCSLESLSGIYDVVVIRIPKNSAFFEDILCHVSNHVASHTQVVCGAMLKYLAPAAFELLARIIGPTHTSLARKKARLVFARVAQVARVEVGAPRSPYPSSVKIEGFAEPFLHHSNLFSRERLDIGTRFFLQNIPSEMKAEYGVILDLGCGNGAIAIAAARLNPQATFILSDDSWMACESARVNFASVCPGRRVQIVWADCYKGQPAETVDLALCNPPFHASGAGGAQTDAIAREMFLSARRSLRVGGLLRVIGNTHLGYGRILERMFGNSRVVAANSKFTIVDAVKA